MLNYAKKAVLFVVTAVLGTNLTAFAIRGEWTTDNTWTLLITVVGAIGVYFILCSTTITKNGALLQTIIESMTWLATVSTL